MAAPGKTSLLCPRCRKLISADEPQCPYCGLRRPGSRWLSGFLWRLSSGALDPVRILIYINVAFFLLSLLLNLSATRISHQPLTLLSPSNSSLFALGATGAIPLGQYGRWWTLISASFLHGGILHIFFNMAALSQLGYFVLREYGFNRFILIYILSGIAGFLLSAIVGVIFTMGASASLCGLIGAILFYGKSRGGFYGEAIYKQATGWIVGLVLFGLFLPGINNWAHGGGLVAGILLGFFLGYEDQSEETSLVQILGTCCIFLTATVLLWAVMRSLLAFFLA
ncbi:rhomboid protease GluP [Syntrophus gentianae]|uniref:Rhomboid protease GluP n=1 Tax=Syntrophus gentianae TaxID=43775 RepID=A0A1H7YEI7_9BACT|nr:rhomboid family intramembrane serine protease [Syntrophus gentianae]SEM43708.1 rhomboid protease GluP [Syntrophus gentianae]